MGEEEIKTERERIKKLCIDKIEKIEKECSEKKTARGKRAIGRSRATGYFKDVIFWIDNPDYKRIIEVKIK